MAGFGLFPRLPTELRYHIWEMTWPEPHVIEATYVDAPEDHGDPETVELVALRKTARLSTWLQHDFGSRILEDSPLEEHQAHAAPIALQVCRESRALTLPRLTLLRHAHLPDHLFYFRPGWDVLWLSTDITDDLYFQEELRENYGQYLDKFERILVEENEWGVPGPYPKCLDIFPGIRCVELLREHDSLSDEEEVGEDEDEEKQDVELSTDQVSESELTEVERGWTIRYVEQSV